MSERYVNLTLRVPEAYVDEFRLICEEGIENGSLFDLLGVQPNTEATGQEVTREIGSVANNRTEMASFSDISDTPETEDV